MSARAALAVLLLALAGVAPPAAADDATETCRRLHADRRPTALERWRGPRSNANRYPVHCENEHFVSTGPIPSYQVPEIGPGIAAPPSSVSAPPPPPPNAATP